MSHTVSVATEVNSESALKKAAERVGAAWLGQGTHRVYSRNYTGLGVQLRGWQHPAVFDVAAKKVHTDTYNGNWGSMDRLDEIHQAYAVERLREEAVSRGDIVTSEQVLQDGSVRLEVEVYA